MTGGVTRKLDKVTRKISAHVQPALELRLCPQINLGPTIFAYFHVKL